MVVGSCRVVGFVGGVAELVGEVLGVVGCGVLGVEVGGDGCGPGGEGGCGEGEESCGGEATLGDGLGDGGAFHGFLFDVSGV